MIERRKVETHAEIYICDKCKIGEMKPTGKNIWSSDEPLFMHKCNNCENEEYLNEKFPAIRFKIIEG